MSALARQQLADATRKTKRGDDASQIIFDLPLPPSVNRLWRYSKNGVYSTATYKAWQICAGWELNTQRRKFAGMFPLHAYKIVVRYPESMRGDCDNYIKPTNDLLQKHGVIENDKHCHEVELFRTADTPRGRCLISLSAHEGSANV